VQLDFAFLALVCLALILRGLSGWLVPLAYTLHFLSLRQVFLKRKDLVTN